MGKQLAFSVTDFALILYSIERRTAHMGTNIFIIYIVAGFGQQVFSYLNLGSNTKWGIQINQKMVFMGILFALLVMLTKEWKVILPQIYNLQNDSVFCDAFTPWEK